MRKDSSKEDTNVAGNWSSRCWLPSGVVWGRGKIAKLDMSAPHTCESNKRITHSRTSKEGLKGEQLAKAHAQLLELLCAMRTKRDGIHELYRTAQRKNVVVFWKAAHGATDCQCSHKPWTNAWASCQRCSGGMQTKVWNRSARFLFQHTVNFFMFS